MCTYNGGNYLKEQMDSIINQTYPVYELIVQDDCSTDSTVNLLKEYEKEYPFIQVYRNEKQKGITANFFSAMKRATGDYIAIADQDDIWVPKKIEIQVTYAKDFLLVAGASQPFADGKAKIYGDEREPNIHLERLIYNCMLSGHAMLFQRALLDKIPATGEPDFFLYDHVIAMIAACYNSIKYIPKVLVYHRRHPGAATYMEPLNFERTLGNMFRIVLRTFGQYRKLRIPMSVYFSHIYSLLESVQEPSEMKENAMRLAWCQSKTSLVNYIRLTCICVRLRDKIFYAPEKNNVLAVLRALYFILVIY
ncbi:hypothetical protein FACS189421_10550 [Bacteroidia bacterium]|nr:hypothetical protein FACS189421_10550 [Bacteroidia bacterium]